MGGPGPGTYASGNKDMVYSDVRPETLVQPQTASPNMPQTLTPSNVTYDQAKYSTPTYGLTPQSGYTGLNQQLAYAFGLQPQGYAAPRTMLPDMYASPWMQLPGYNMNVGTLGQLWGQDPMQGRQTPPGTYVPGQAPPNLPPTTPPQLPPQRQGPLEPAPPPGTSAPSSPGPLGSAPPATNPTTPGTRTPPTFPNQPPPATNTPNTGLLGNKMGGGNWKATHPNPTGGSGIVQDGDGAYHTADWGANYGQMAPGFMQSMANAGGDVGRYGAAAAMMANARNANYRQPTALTHEQLLQAGAQGIRPNQMRHGTWEGGKWRRNGQDMGYTDEAGAIPTTPVRGIYGKGR